MADLDDLPAPHSHHHHHPDSTDIDLTDEPQDFRFLSYLSSLPTTSTSSHQTLPRRGEKDFEPHGTQSQASSLSASRHAMHTALSVGRSHNPKSLLVGRYDADDGSTIIEQARGSHSRNVGRHDARGRLHLLPEEALYLIERGDMHLRYASGEVEGVPLSLQAAYAYLLGERGLSLERYMVYTGLKRNGYVVQRAPTWYPEDFDEGELPLRERGNEAPLGLWPWFCRSLLEGRIPEKPAQGPLIAPGLYRSYADIYRLLNTIPAHDPTLPTDREAHRSSASMGHPTSPTHPRIRCAWHVWKPTSNFRKTAPPPPDFRIAVIDAREQGFPVLEQLDDLLQSVPYDPPPAGTGGQVYKRLKHGYRNVLMAVVDQGVISYMRVSDAGFSKEKIYERHERRGSKRGGNRGAMRGGMRGGQGRGRGRGRGR